VYLLEPGFAHADHDELLELLLTLVEAKHMGSIKKKERERKKIMCLKSGDVKRGRLLLQTDPSVCSHGVQLALVILAHAHVCSTQFCRYLQVCDFSN